ncbi:MAG: hypothetical protein AAF570_14370, partial [Bacteroidota bacterium]
MNPTENRSDSQLPEFLNAFHLTAIQVVFRVLERDRLPDFPPDRIKRLRGAFNAALTSTHCRGNNYSGRPCSECHCIYGTLSGKHWTGQQMHTARFSEAPSPILFWLPQNPGRAVPGREIRFNVTLIGHTGHYLPYLYPVFNHMARQCLGHESASYELDRIVALDAEGLG